MMTDHVMTKEIREKLLTRLPFSRSASIDYTPTPYLTKDENGEYEIPEEYRPVFTVRPFSSDDKAKMDKQKMADEKLLRDITRGNITGVSRLYDAGTMKEIDFKADENGSMDKDQFNSLPVSVMRDLFIYISGISGLAPYEKAGLKS